MKEADIEDVMMVSDSNESFKKYIPKQFDMDKLINIEDETLRNMLFNLMTSDSNMFREETRTTLESYGLIIDQREGNINRLMND